MALSEDKEIGPLFKTILHKKYYKENWWQLLKPYPFSVSKINHVLNLFFISLWTILLITFFIDKSNTKQLSVYYVLISLLGVISIVSMILFAITGGRKPSKKGTHVNFDKRKIEDSETKK